MISNLICNVSLKQLICSRALEKKQQPTTTSTKIPKIPNQNELPKYNTIPTPKKPNQAKLKQYISGVTISCICLVQPLALGQRWYNHSNLMKCFMCHKPIIYPLYAAKKD